MRANNKLRESMAQVKEIARTIYSTSDKGSHHEDLAEKIVELANAALAAPPRNCDVGTIQEQDERFAMLCPKRRWGNCMLCRTRARLVDFLNSKKTKVRECTLVWAQMPYEKGDDKGGVK